MVKYKFMVREGVYINLEGFNVKQIKYLYIFI